MLLFVCAAAASRFNCSMVASRFCSDSSSSFFSLASRVAKFPCAACRRACTKSFSSCAIFPYAAVS
eukprot:4333824-Pleurochrysis_carterae.AAC.1